jgi:hypothetical protein
MPEPFPVPEPFPEPEPSPLPGPLDVDEPRSIARRLVAEALERERSAGPPPLPVHLVPVPAVPADPTTEVLTVQEVTAELAVEDPATELSAAEATAELPLATVLDEDAAQGTDEVLVEVTAEAEPMGVEAAGEVAEPPVLEAVVMPLDPVVASEEAAAWSATFAPPQQEEPEPEIALVPRRTGRWVLTTIIAAVGLALLLPLAVAAVRELFRLSTG